MNAPAVILVPPQRRVQPKTAAQFLALAMIWGSTWIVIKGQLGTVPVAWSVSYRFLIAGTAMTLLCVALRRPLKLPLAGHAVAGIAAVLQFLLNFNLVYQSERYVTSGLVALVFAMIIVPNTGFARLFLGQRISGRFVAGSLLGIAGVAMLVARDLDVKGAGVAVGLGLAVAAVLCASLANVMQASDRARVLPLEPLLAATLTYGGVVCAAYALVTSGPPQFDPRAEYWAGVFYLGLVASALAFRLYYALIRSIGPARAGYVNVVVPLVAMTASTLFEGFVWTPLAALGGGLALTGLVVALRSRG